MRMYLMLDLFISLAIVRIVFIHCSEWLGRTSGEVSS